MAGPSTPRSPSKHRGGPQPVRGRSPPKAASPTKAAVAGPSALKSSTKAASPTRRTMAGPSAPPSPTKTASPTKATMAGPSSPKRLSKILHEKTANATLLRVVVGLEDSSQKNVTICPEPVREVSEGFLADGFDSQFLRLGAQLSWPTGTSVSPVSSTTVGECSSSLLVSSMSRISGTKKIVKSRHSSPINLVVSGKKKLRHSSKSPSPRQAHGNVQLFLDTELGAVQKAPKSECSSSRRSGFGDIDSWSPLRLCVYDVVVTTYFEIFITFLIVCSFMSMMYEADQDALCYPKYKNDKSSCPTSLNNIAWLRASHISFLALYTLEAAAFIYVQRLRYFQQRTKLLDFFIVVAGLVAECTTVFGKLGWLRILRVHHLFRHPGLEMFYLRGFTGAVRAIAVGGFLLACMLVCVSVPVVQHIHPTNVEIEYDKCERCSRGYASVAASTLTLYQQTVIGDEWGLMSIPNMEQSWKAAIGLPLIQLAVVVGVLSLIVAVIVHCSVEARTLSKKEELQEKVKLQRSRKLQMLQIFEAIDVKKTGFVTFKQLSTIMDAGLFVWMKDVGLGQADLADIFECIDDKSLGKVSYIELANVLVALTQMPANVAATLARAKVECLDRKVTDIHEELKDVNRKLDLLIARESSPRVEAAQRNAAAQGIWQETNMLDCDLREMCLNALGIGHIKHDQLSGVNKPQVSAGETAAAKELPGDVEEVGLPTETVKSSQEPAPSRPLRTPRGASGANTPNNSPARPRRRHSSPNTPSTGNSSTSPAKAVAFTRALSAEVKQPSNWARGHLDGSPPQPLSARTIGGGSPSMARSAWQIEQDRLMRRSSEIGSTLSPAAGQASAHYRLAALDKPHPMLLNADGRPLSEVWES